jgi:hypothetical protein
MFRPKKWEIWKKLWKLWKWWKTQNRASEIEPKSVEGYRYMYMHDGDNPSFWDEFHEIYFFLES